MARIAVCTLIAAAVLLGCGGKPQQAIGPEAAAPLARPVADLAPESAPPPGETPREQPTRVTSLSPPSAPTTPAGRVYTVQKGDTLWAIARKLYGDPRRSEDIAQANNIADATKLRVGQVLSLP